MSVGNKRGNSDEEEVPVPAKVARPAPKEPQQPRIYMGIDVEKAGRHRKDSLLAIGVCIGDTEVGVRAKQTWCIGGPDNKRWEIRCMTEFWANQTELLKRIEKEGLPKAEALKGFEDFCKKWEKDNKVILVSDNPLFDGGAIDDALEELQEDHVPIHYTRDGRYRSVEDCSERYDGSGMPWALLDGFLTNIGVSHDHYPENDAEKHFWTHMVSKAFTHLIKSNPKSPVEKLYDKMSILLSPRQTAEGAKRAILAYAQSHDDDSC